MSKHTAIIVLGILVILVPFSGFPHSWKTFLSVVFGAVIVLLSYLGRRSMMQKLTSEKHEQA